MLQTTFIIVWILLVTAYFASAVVIFSFLGLNGKTGHRIGQLWGRAVLFGSRVHVTVKGLGRISTSQSYVYMSNHQSNFDIFVLLGCLPVQFRWLAKAELFKIPIFGRSMRECGYISIDRSDRQSAIQSLNSAADAIRGGVSVMIFPEGTRSRDGSIRPFKKGGFVLAIESGVPIVPVVIHHTFAVMSRNSLRISPREVVLEILEPVDTAAVTYRDKDVLMNRVRSRICEAFEAGLKKERCT
jgi:1-acyl-sn-glycerol-3-phosphate acyltransferase